MTKSDISDYLSGMEHELAAHLRIVAQAFAASRDLTLTTVGRMAAGDWRFFDRLDDPKKTFTARTYDRVICWFADNWPDDLPWPSQVPHPASDRTGAAA